MAKNLIAGLCAAHPENRYLATVPDAGGYEEFLGEVESLGLVVYKYRGLLHRAIWEQTILASRSITFNPDVVIALGNFGVSRPPCPQITLVQDSHLFYPERHYGKIGKKDLWRFRLQRHFMRQSLAYNDRYLCQTKVARRRFLATYGRRVSVGLSHNIAPSLVQRTHPYDEPAVCGITRDRFRFLVPAKFYAHKNLEVILEVLLASRILRERGAFLVTISPDESAGAKRFWEKIQAAGLTEAVHLIGQLDIASLYAYYQHCEGVFLPTLLESATAVYPEAVMFGKPLATSDLDFAREVCGEGTIFFNPWDRESVAQALLNMMDKPVAIKGGALLFSAEAGGWERIAEDLHQNAKALAEYYQVL